MSRERTAESEGPIGTGGIKNPGQNAHNLAVLKAAFPMSPMHKGDTVGAGKFAMTTEGLRAQYNAEVLNGVVPEAVHWGLAATWEPGYKGGASIDAKTTKIGTVEAGKGGGAPGTWWTPNTASPSKEGSGDATDLPAAPNLVHNNDGTKTASYGWGSGHLDPAATSLTMSKKTLGDFLVMGESGAVTKPE